MTMLFFSGNSHFPEDTFLFTVASAACTWPQQDIYFCQTHCGRNCLDTSELHFEEDLQCIGVTERFLLCLKSVLLKLQLTGSIFKLANFCSTCIRRAVLRRTNSSASSCQIECGSSKCRMLGITEAPSPPCPKGLLAERYLLSAKPRE
ncbi:hypothetical protein R1flu_012842 [Riccia fluitans]|uniref:Uncharacterized protein n=1 Tax=Riccia fluitans TaxID=41844 RepID=A0ABD1ZBQ6_9MARC